MDLSESVCGFFDKSLDDEKKLDNNFIKQIREERLQKLIAKDFKEENSIWNITNRIKDEVLYDISSKLEEELFFEIVNNFIF